MRTLVKVLVALGAAAALGLGIALGTSWPRDAKGVAPQARDDRSVTPDQLRSLSNTRIFFAHQSVGDNILGELPEVYARAGVDEMPLVELSSARLPDDLPRGALVHTHIGVNGDPQGKITAFAEALRGGLGDQIDVAVLKFCYVDFNAETDVQGLFDRYRSTLSELAKQFPDIVFVPATAALTTEDGAKQAAKNLLGRTPDNAVREEFNAMVRAEYADSGLLFDLAGAQSTTPEGTRVSRSYNGRVHYALYSGYALDEGHLNVTGSQRAASELLASAARASSTR
ncbi:hypothetical protein SAMN05443377_1183 [Propionibacterium cyclohexanicum]|uniref:GDSL-like Lipase/Acylhydrolase family protein n=1 Tax=Propionibacterium cyclohexanicum TaxID=64702 RepID=A0A1H9T2I4_9ACTN|nr:hypothetical protein [Propionibacterium cyclohexanicum]SER91214.1 hypothetical protein SAMN05443377_1183 [Propionibacterium cyclohexanicum]